MKVIQVMMKEEVKQTHKSEIRQDGNIAVNTIKRKTPESD